MIRRTSPSGYAGCCHAIAALDLTDRLQEIALPALIVVGEEDPGTLVTAAREIYESIGGSEITILKSASRLSNMERQETYTTP